MRIRDLLPVIIASITGFLISILTLVVVLAIIVGVILLIAFALEPSDQTGDGGAMFLIVGVAVTILLMPLLYEISSYPAIVFAGIIAAHLAGKSRKNVSMSETILMSTLTGGMITAFKAVLILAIAVILLYTYSAQLQPLNTSTAATISIISTVTLAIFFAISPVSIVFSTAGGIIYVKIANLRQNHIAKS